MTGMRLHRAAAAGIIALGLAAVALSNAMAAAPGQPCGGPMHFVCGSGLWCDWPAGKCGSENAQGKCVEILAVCPKGGKSVCGCDKRTYGSDCERVRAGVQSHVSTSA